MMIRKRAKPDWLHSAKPGQTKQDSIRENISTSMVPAPMSEAPKMNQKMHSEPSNDKEIKWENKEEFFVCWLTFWAFLSPAIQKIIVCVSVAAKIPTLQFTWHQEPHELAIKDNIPPKPVPISTLDRRTAREKKPTKQM